MKVEIEISEQDLREAVEIYLSNNLRKRYDTQPLSGIIEQQTNKALTKAFEDAGFGEIIEKACRELALVEVEKAAAKKVPGWVNQQMKEMLKYARYNFLKELGG